MVDFNNDATIGTPRGDILSVLILQRRNDVIEAIEAYKKIGYQGSDGAPLYLVRARLSSLYLEIRAALKNSMSEKDFKSLSVKVASDDIGEMGSAFELMDDWLYSKNIIKIDTRKAIDTDDIEAVNDGNNL
jgi:hypothetical protein